MSEEAEISLVPMTRALCHTYFRHFENDPAIYQDMSLFAAYRYDPCETDRYFDMQQKPNRLVFMILRGGVPVGEVKLKDIDREKCECTLGIHLQSDACKGQGIGTAAERLALAYAFETLRMNAVNADAVLKNTRSQHVLEKVGFRYMKTEDIFKYYRVEKAEFEQRMTVRPFREADRPRLAALYAESRRADFVWLKHPVAEEDFDRDTEGERILVAEAGGQTAGFVSVWEPTSFIHLLFVCKDCRRRGVGRALLDVAAATFPPPLTLKCVKANTKAAAFYRAEGWTVLREEVGEDGAYHVLRHE